MRAKVVGKHTAAVNQVVVTEIGQADELIVTPLNKFRHRRHRESGKIGQRAGAGAPQVSSQKRWHIFGEVGGDGQRYDVGSVNIVRLGFDPIIEKGMAPGPTRVAYFKLDVHNSSAPGCSNPSIDEPGLAGKANFVSAVRRQPPQAQIAPRFLKLMTTRWLRTNVLNWYRSNAPVW